MKSTSANIIENKKRTSSVTTICCCICSAGVRCGCFLARLCLPLVKAAQLTGPSAGSAGGRGRAAGRGPAPPPQPPGGARAENHAKTTPEPGHQPAGPGGRWACA